MCYIYLCFMLKYMYFMPTVLLKENMCHHDVNNNHIYKCSYFVSNYRVLFCQIHEVLYATSLLLTCT